MDPLALELEVEPTCYCIIFHFLIIEYKVKVDATYT